MASWILVTSTSYSSLDPYQRSTTVVMDLIPATTSTPMMLRRWHASGPRTGIACRLLERLDKIEYVLLSTSSAIAAVTQCS
jgi:hypothetical protein